MTRLPLSSATTPAMPSSARAVALACALVAAFVLALPAVAAEAASSSLTEVEARNLELAERFLTQVYVERDFDAIPDYIAADFVDHSPGAPPDAHGPDFVRRQAESTRAAFPDFAFETLHTVVQDDLVTLHWRMTGTASEAIAGPGAAGKPVKIQGISLFRYDADGKVAESWDLVDRASMLQQLGFEMRPPGGDGG